VSPHSKPADAMRLSCQPALRFRGAALGEGPVVVDLGRAPDRSGLRTRLLERAVGTPPPPNFAGNHPARAGRLGPSIEPRIHFRTCLGAVHEEA